MERDENIICPYCGHKQSDPWEYFTGRREDTTITCGECEKDFRATQHTAITYSTRPA